MILPLLALTENWQIELDRADRARSSRSRRSIDQIEALDRADRAEARQTIVIVCQAWARPVRQIDLSKVHVRISERIDRARSIDRSI